MPKAGTGLFLACALGSVVVLAGCFQQAHQTPQTSMDSISPIIGPVRYVALGDSTGAGVGARTGGYVDRMFQKILAQRPGSKLTNLCVSGATTQDVLFDQLDQVASADPNLITLTVGINDIGHGVPLEVFERNYEEILSRLKKSSSAVVVVNNIPEISSAPRIPQAIRSEYRQSIVRYNQKLEEVASRHGVVVFDIFTITQEQLPAHPEYFSEDGFHPSDQGYELWAETMWPTIARVIGVDVAP